MMFPFQQYLAKVTVLFLCLWAWMWAQFGPLISCRCSISVARWCVFNMFFMAVAVLGWSCIQDTPSFPSVPHQTTPQTLVTQVTPVPPKFKPKGVKMIEHLPRNRRGATHGRKWVISTVGWGDSLEGQGSGGRVSFCWTNFLWSQDKCGFPRIYSTKAWNLEVLNRRAFNACCQRANLLAEAEPLCCT